MLDTYLKMLDLCYFEAGEAFKELADGHVWRRPADGLLSVGELAAHVAYWEAVRYASDGPGLTQCKIQSPLLDDQFAYYTDSIEHPQTGKHLGMSADEVHRELVRVHEESMAVLKSLAPDLSSTPPSLKAPWTYQASLEYSIFHISYHTGQMYSARHLLGEQTPDN